VDFEYVLVVGAGQMGGGIAQVVAASGRHVSLCDAQPGATDRALEGMRKSLGKLEEKGGAPAEEVLRRITVVDDLVPAALMVEAVVEDADTKEQLFHRADEELPPAAILASNTSSIPIGTLAAATDRPDKVIGMHFFNPPPVMRLIEVTPALTTSDATIGLVRELGERLGKTIVMAKDEAGFIVNRLLIPYLCGAIRLLDQGFATRDDIDASIELGLKHPMGPLRLADLIGLDTVLQIAEVLFGEFPEATYAPPPLLRRMVAAGRLGRKSGAGFYEYD
jgi:3-hydroxybutyryl-CoA dehydrogenase